MTPIVPLTDAIALLRLVGHGEVSTGDVAAAVMERIEQTAALNCVTELPSPDLTPRAQECADGPLRGLPVVVKDCFDTLDAPTTGGTAALAGCRPPHDAEAVARLRRAGAFVAAKNTMHELSFGITSNNAWSGPARNPVNPTLIPGGSSGGTAAAVAAGIAPIGLAADTGGSSRLPAALCGVVGFRPTAGRYPTTGVLPISHTRDTPGVIAHSVADIALVDPILAESSVAATPPRATSLSGVQLGAPTQFWEDLDPQVERVCRRAWEALDSAGAIIIEVDVSPLLALTAQVGLPLCLYEFPRGLRAYLEANEYPITPENVFDAVASPDVRAITAAARDLGTISDEAYAQVLAAREHLVTSYAELLRANRLAALVFPTAPLPARPIGQDDTVELNGRLVPTFATYIRHTDLAGNAGHPGISLRVGLTDAGLPVGLELDGHRHRDLELLALAAAVESRLTTPS